MTPIRVIAYVDAYNVYHGLRSKGYKRYYWLDYRALFLKSIADDRTLVGVRYFTALGRGARQGDQAADDRHSNYLDALAANGGVEVMDQGRFKSVRVTCPHCRSTWNRPQEKQTDVNIAVAMVSDAHDDKFDEAWLMCADADLVPAVNHILSRFPNKRVVVIPPRGRRSDELNNAGSAVIQIGTAKFNQSQLPDPVIDSVGREYRRPATWT